MTVSGAIEWHEGHQWRFLRAHVLDALAALPEGSVQTVVTSPPYWLLRNYGLPVTTWGGKRDCAHAFEPIGTLTNKNADKGHGLQSRNHGSKTIGPVVTSGYCRHCGAWAGDYGLEPTLDLYLHHTVEIFRGVARVLKDDGTLWLNMGDVYASGKGTCVNPGGGDNSFGRIRKTKNIHPTNRRNVSDLKADGLKPKDLIGLPWRVAFALQADGWYLRRDIVWAKSNPMPESVRDRPTTSHEYIFLFSKQPRYYYDWAAIADACKPRDRPTEGRNSRLLVSRDPRHLFEDKNSRVPMGWDTKQGPHTELTGRYPKGKGPAYEPRPIKNKRSVWTVASRAYKGAHFATFPPRLIEPCILAGSRPGDWILDPFLGSGTTAAVALAHGRACVGIELNPAYLDLALSRVRQVQLQLPAKGVLPCNQPIQPT